jgi:membrane protein
VDRIKKLVVRVKAVSTRVRSRSAPIDIAFRTVERFSKDDGGWYAAGLTYYIFFSIFPLLLVAGAILGFLTFADADLKQRLVDQGFKTIPLLRDVLTPDGLRIVAERRGTLAITGIALGLYSGSGGIIALEHALNRFHGITDEPNWIAKRLRSLRFLAILGSAILVSLALTTVGNFAAEFMGGGHTLTTIISFVAGFLVGIAIFATAFRWLPAVNLTWGDVLPGAIVGAVAFQLMQVGGTYYLARGEATRNDTFGAFAAAAALLVAAYLISQITLLAAEVNLAIRDHRNKRES